MYPGNLRYFYQHSADLSQWKMEAFLKTQEEMDSQALTNIVAIGDNQIEMDAAQHLAK